MTRRLNKHGMVLFRCAGIALMLLLWHTASLCFPPLVAPPIHQVGERFYEIMTSRDTAGILLTTAGRLFWGLLFGILAGSIFGLLAGNFPAADAMLAPFLNAFQSVPPVSWLVLALVWFGFNGRPTIFIVAMASVPPVAINLRNGVSHIDRSLLQMAKLYRLSDWTTFREIILPSVSPYFFSAVEIVLGSGWKLCVMGEVLTTTTGIGGKIVEARLNIEPDLIIAWSVILVALCWASQKLISLLIMRKGKHYGANALSAKHQ